MWFKKVLLIRWDSGEIYNHYIWLYIVGGSGNYLAEEEKNYTPEHIVKEISGSWRGRWNSKPQSSTQLSLLFYFVFRQPVIFIPRSLCPQNGPLEPLLWNKLTKPEQTSKGKYSGYSKGRGSLLPYLTNLLTFWPFHK